LWHQIAGLICRDRAGDDSARDTAGSSQGSLARHIDVWDVLVFAEEGKMQEDGKWCGVGGEDDDLRGTAIESFGC